MPYYYVNRHRQANGDHEVHEKACAHGAAPQYQQSLGLHANCRGAVKEAKWTYSTANGCVHCCPDCHTG